MDKVETEQIKKSLLDFPELVKKIETYFSKETPEIVVTPVVEEVKEEAKVEVETKEEDFSAVITAMEKTFVKSSDFTAQADAFKATSETIVSLTKANEELNSKFAKQDETIKEIFELVKKIGSTPSEESKFKKKDGVKVVEKSGIDRLMAEAAELSKQTFK